MRHFRPPRECGGRLQIDVRAGARLEVLWGAIFSSSIQHQGSSLAICFVYLGLGLSKFTSHLALRWWYSPLVSQAQEDRDPFGMALLEWFLDCVSSAPFPVSHKKSQPRLPSSANVSKVQVSFSILPTTPTWLPPELSASPRRPYFLAILSII